MTFTAYDPRTGQPGLRTFEDATAKEVGTRTDAAQGAFAVSRRYSSQRIAAVLHAVAEELDALGEAVIDVADRETGLGRPRLVGELARTTGQFRLFAALCEEGSYVDAVIDHARPDRAPPSPDLRRLLIPLGPVAVFGASNFPLAFSVPGGDTASALAARCPVVAKAHPSHRETSQLCAEAIWRGLRAAGAPEAMFSIVHGRGREVGEALVLAPEIAAVGFTGSHRGGRALYNLAASRERPIPVFAEMGSVNPFFITEDALRARLEETAKAFAASVTQGNGQFCTKPGIAFVPDSERGRQWTARVAEEIQRIESGCLLNAPIRDALAKQVEHTRQTPGVESLTAESAREGHGYVFPATAFAASAKTFISTPALREEHFGPVALIVRCASPDEMIAMARGLQGNLTATLHAEAGEAGELENLVEELRLHAGRLIWNGYPTGVAVTHAMVHGGPYPASTFPAHTSVGTAAIRRFLRPVAYQSYPPELLPPELRDDNPLKIMRLVDGAWSQT